MKAFWSFAIGTILLGSCSGKKFDEKEYSVFRYNESKGITTLDPAFSRSLPLIWPVYQIYNGLVQLDDSLNILPSIAHSWEVSNDGLQYTFHLRNDVFFHNSQAFHDGKGRRVVADDFVFSFGRIIDPQVASPGAWIFSVLDTQNMETLNGCKSENDSTLIIYLKKPFPAFLGLLSMPYAFVVPREAIEYFGKDYRSNPVGTGPFQIKYWREGEKLILRRNPNYFEVDENGERLPYLQAVSISFITDKQSEFLELLLGNIDFISGVYAASKDELLTREGKLNPKYSDRLRMITGPYLNTEYLGILVDTTLDAVRLSSLSNIKIRKAIGYGFDREKLMTYLRSNMGYPAYNGFVPSGMPGFSEKVKGFVYDPELSKQLLAEAGYPGGKGLSPITLSTTDDYVDICEFVQHQLSEVGIPIEIEVFPGAAYREMMANSRLTFFRGSWVADYADPENYLSLFLSENFSPGGPNYTHYSNSEFDFLYRNSLYQKEDSLRSIIYNTMDSMIMESVPVIPMYYDKVVRFVNKEVIGLKSNPMNLLNLKRVKKIREK